MKSGMDADDAYVSRWRYMKSMEFLKDHVCIAPKGTMTNLSLTQVSNAFILYLSISKVMFVLL